jgi:hypothetical protein
VAAMSRSAATISGRRDTVRDAGPADGAGELWRFPAALEGEPAQAQIAGFATDATDGFVGTVGVARSDPAGAYLIVLGGPWNGGRTVMIPGALVNRIEPGARVVHLSCSRQQIREAPPYENDRYQDAAYRAEVSAYYTSLQPSFRLRGLDAARRAVALARASVAFGSGAAG